MPLDKSDIPERALKRIDTIHDAGFQPQGFVIVHEIPKQNTPPRSSIDLGSLELNTQLVNLLKLAGGAFGALAVITGTILIGLFALVLILPVLAIATILVIDPILVAVMEDDTWVEIDRWLTE